MIYEPKWSEVVVKDPKVDERIDELNRVTLVELLRKDMNAAENAMRGIVAEAMFGPSMRDASNMPPPKPLTRWQKAMIRFWWPIRNYLVTLEKALLGYDLVEYEDHDDY